MSQSLFFVYDFKNFFFVYDFKNFFFVHDFKNFFFVYDFKNFFLTIIILFNISHWPQLNGSEYCYVSLTIQLDSHLFTHC